MKTTKAAVIAAAEKLGWRVSFEWQKSNRTGKTDKFVEFNQYTPAGEDFGFFEFYDRLSDLPRLLMERYQDFDSEKHAAEWYGANNGEPSSLRELLEDAEEIKKMIYALAIAME